MAADTNSKCSAAVSDDAGTGEATVSSPQPNPLLGYVEAVLTGLSSIFAPILLFLAVGYMVVIWIIRSRAARPTYNGDRSIPIEAMIAIFTIPIVSIVTTVGTSMGLYVVTQYPHFDSFTFGRTGYIPGGWIIVTLSVGVSIAVLIVGWTTLLRHRHGSYVLPFEFDADPAKAIAQLERWSSEMPTKLLPGISLSAKASATHAANDAPDARPPSVREALQLIRNTERPAYSEDRRQALSIILVALSVFATYFALTVVSAGQWWHVAFSALYLAAGLFAIGWIAAEVFVFHFWVYLKYDRRITVLRERQKVADSAIGREDVLSDEIQKLKEGIRELRELLGSKSQLTQADTPALVIIDGKRLRLCLQAKAPAMWRFFSAR